MGAKEEDKGRWDVGLDYRSEHVKFEDPGKHLSGYFEYMLD